MIRITVKKSQNRLVFSVCSHQISIVWTQTILTYHELLGDTVVHWVAGWSTLHKRVLFELIAEDWSFFIALTLRPTAATGRLWKQEKQEKWTHKKKKDKKQDISSNHIKSYTVRLIKLSQQTLSLTVHFSISNALQEALRCNIKYHTEPTLGYQPLCPRDAHHLSQTVASTYPKGPGKPHASSTAGHGTTTIAHCAVSELYNNPRQSRGSFLRINSSYWHLDNTQCWILLISLPN